MYLVHLHIARVNVQSTSKNSGREFVDDETTLRSDCKQPDDHRAATLSELRVKDSTKDKSMRQAVEVLLVAQ